MVPSSTFSWACLAFLQPPHDSLWLNPAWQPECREPVTGSCLASVLGGAPCLFLSQCAVCLTGLGKQEVRPCGLGPTFRPGWGNPSLRSLLWNGQGKHKHSRVPSAVWVISSVWGLGMRPQLHTWKVAWLLPQGPSSSSALVSSCLGPSVSPTGHQLERSLILGLASLPRLAGECCQPSLWLRDGREQRCCLLSPLGTRAESPPSGQGLMLLGGPTRGYFSDSAHSSPFPSAPERKWLWEGRTQRAECTSGAEGQGTLDITPPSPCSPGLCSCPEGPECGLG